MMKPQLLGELRHAASHCNRGVDGGCGCGEGRVIKDGRFDHVQQSGKFPHSSQSIMWGKPAHVRWVSPTISAMQNQNIVRTLRRKRGLKQAELAAELGISRSHLSKVENGSDAAGRQLLEAMAVYFRVPIDTFFPLSPKGADAVDHRNHGSDLGAQEDEVLALWRAMDSEEQRALLTLLRRKAHSS
ncbi:helix-turn-helix domain-containing protein [Pseudoroseomonas ludipueritiae]|uniref:Helix-turn-helix transcriptional regulator n=1 Tax=Pseudoroseomonas ludipueritiae TaxID=198093 RepID=A0ABR7R7U2_9PROT|nr:helix-turn-helix transcriptional regulator [Pseudoroseomonas ludipueritiae]MBC9177815.1 helix-turn-helix transcriptional regulator [Pseudoroseomonas ludipueritiae]MCG7363159.1 helix-turn-helix transcriptional regulator [Roseomonas sp. ACRSG]